MRPEGFTQGARISTLSLPTPEHKSLHWRSLLTERAAVIYSPSLSLSASLSLLTVVGSPCHCELLALLFSVHETGREEAVVLFFLSPASSNLHTGGYLKAASTRALTMSAISGSKVPGNHMLYPPYHDLRVSTGRRSSSSFMLFQLLQHVQVPC